MENNKTKIANNVLWSFLSRWSSKLIGMVNTVVLARLLSPDDFGIVALATIMLTLLDSLTQVGVHLFVIRMKEDDQRIFNTAWTVNFIQAALIAVVLALSAPFIADFYGQEVLVNVVYCIALVKLISGFENFGIYIAQKHLQFNIDFKFTFYSRLIYSVASIGFAVWLENYWAIIFGQLVSVICRVLISYKIHWFRPAFSLFGWRDLFQYSKSTLPMSVGRFVNNQADVAVIGRVAGTDFLGNYHVASNLSGLFTKELLIPLIRGMVPNLAILRESDNFPSILRLIICSAVYFFLPIGVGLSLVSEEFVLVFLGSQWSAAAPIIAWLAIYTMLGGMMMFISEQFLIVLGKEKLSNRLMWLRNGFIVAAIAVSLYQYDYNVIPVALVISALISFPLIILIVARSMELKFFFLVVHWWPAFVGVATMYLVLNGVQWPNWHELILLPVKVLAGAVVYVLVIASLYLVRRSPQGTPEALIIAKVKKRDFDVQG